MNSIARTLKFFKAVFADARCALHHSPPAERGYRRVMLLDLGSHVVPMAVT